MVETMFVLLPTLALITAFFDVSYALFNWTTLQNAAREGCRYAITFQRNGTMGQDASIRDKVVQQSMGLLSANTTLVQVNYFTQANPNTEVQAPNGNVPGNIVEVAVEGYPLNWMIPIAGTVYSPFRSQQPTTVSVYSRDVMGGYPAGQTSVPR
jgi:Flp pilus assembly protein TadG